MSVTYTTDDLSPEDRLPHFDELQVNSEHPMRVTSRTPGGFVARARSLDLGAVNVVDLHCSSARVIRTPQLVRQHDPELLCVLIARSGRLAITQAGRETVLGAGELALYTSSQPFEIDIHGGEGTARLVRAHVPRSLLSGVQDGLVDTLATAQAAHKGVGMLLSQFLTRVTDDADEYLPTDLPRLGNLAVDLMTATLSHESDAVAAGSGGQAGMLPRIMAFAHRQLQDPQLSPRSIAAAHHISVSYLHRLFQQQDTTLGAWIRQERLDRARRDLTDPRLLDLPVHRIAARWGYRDHATFTRAFSATFGVPPRDYRNNLVDAGDDECTDPLVRL